MSANTDLEATLRHYVLGELKEEARLQLEERLVTAPEVFESLGVVEDDLAEDYLNGRLSETERTGFEQTFLCTSDRRWQVRFIRLLKDHAAASATAPAKPQTYPELPVPAAKVVDAAPEAGTRLASAETGRRWSLATLASLLQPQPAWRLSLAAALVVLLAGNLWFALRGGRLEDEVDRLRADHSVGQAEQRRLQARVDELSLQARLLDQQLRSAKAQPQHGVASSAPPASQTTGAAGQAARAIPTFALSTGLLRGEGSLPRIALPAGAEAVRLRLPVPAIDYPLYRAALEDADGEEIWAHSRLTAGAAPGGAVIVVQLPADLLKPGDYQLKLSGTDGSSAPESVGTYTFRVTRTATSPR